MGKQRDNDTPPPPLTGANLEVHSLSLSSTATGGYNGSGRQDYYHENDINDTHSIHSDESYDFEIDRDNCENVSDITTLTRDIDLAEFQEQGRLHRGRRPANRCAFILSCSIFIVCLLSVMLIRRREQGGIMSPKTTIYGTSQHQTDSSSESQQVVVNDITESDLLPDGRIIEFLIANLNKNATNKFRIQLHSSWAPIGVERFEYLTTSDFWKDCRIFRIVKNFVVQFGISSDPIIQAGWEAMGPIIDDPVVASNDRGTVTFATAGEDTRTTEIFINTANNKDLDDQGFAPVGEVLPAGEGYGGMEVIDEFYSGYGEKPDQERITGEGETYLDEEFPLLSYIVKAEFIDEGLFG